MILAHDFGTTGNKACLYSDGGELLAATVVEYPTDYGKGGKAEQDPDRWWGAVAAATGPSSASHRPAVAAVSFSGQMRAPSFWPMRAGPLRPAIIWADTRAQAQARSLMGEWAWSVATGSRAIASTPRTPSRRRCGSASNEPEVISGTRAVLLAKDFVALTADGAACDRSLGRVGHQRLRPARRRVVGEILAAADDGRGTPARGGRQRPRSLAAFKGRLRDRPPGGHAGRARRRGRPDGRPRGRCGFPRGRHLCLPRFFGSGSRWPPRSPAGLADAHDDLRPRGPRPVRAHGYDAGGWRLDGMGGDLLGPVRTADRYERLVAARGSVEAAGEGLILPPVPHRRALPLLEPPGAWLFVGLAKHHGPAHPDAGRPGGGGDQPVKVCLDACEARARTYALWTLSAGGALGRVAPDHRRLWGATVRRRSLVDEANSLGAAVVAGVGSGSLTASRCLGVLQGRGLLRARPGRTRPLRGPSRPIPGRLRPAGAGLR